MKSKRRGKRMLSFEVNERLASAIDSECTRRGVSRSYLIRHLLHKGLNLNESAMADDLHSFIKSVEGSKE